MNTYLIEFMSAIMGSAEMIEQARKTSIAAAIGSTKAVVKSELMRLYYSDANIMDGAARYFAERQKYNEEIFGDFIAILEEVMEIGGELNFPVHWMIMSSFPHFNIINDSDIDIGMLFDLTEERLAMITDLLHSHGFVYKCRTPTRGLPGADAYRFEKIIKGIEVEIKARDRRATAAICGLHYHMDNRLNDAEYMFWTYHKMLLKNAAKESKACARAYHEFKTILYNYYLPESSVFMFE